MARNLSAIEQALRDGPLVVQIDLGGSGYDVVADVDQSREQGLRVE